MEGAPDIDPKALEDYLKKEGFSTGNIGIGEVYYLLMDTIKKSSIAAVAKDVYAQLYNTLKVLLDVFNVNSNNIKEGRFVEVITKELHAILYESKTVGDAFKLVKKGSLPMISMIFILTLIVMLVSTHFLSKFVDVYETHNEKEGYSTSKSSHAHGAHGQGVSKDEKEEEEVQLRDFTVSQLRQFDGRPAGPGGMPGGVPAGPKGPSKEATNVGPIYVSVKGNVYDVSGAADLYGPGQSYHCMAGREASRALAKLSFDEADLSNTDITDLGPFQRETLAGWEEKFRHYKSYPIVGKCVFATHLVPAAGTPLESLPLYTAEQMAKHNGNQAVPTGRTHAPIWIGLNGKVSSACSECDVSVASTFVLLSCLTCAICSPACPNMSVLDNAGYSA